MTTFPRIIRFLGTDDCPDSSCPHCGCTGRYITRFVVEDGRTLGAMRGCLALFPVSPVAQEEQRLIKKQERLAKNGWKLNRADRAAMDAIAQFHAGGISEWQALRECQDARRSASLRLRERRE